MQSPALLSLLIRHEQTVYSQAQQSAACFATHHIHVAHTLQAANLIKYSRGKIQILDVGALQEGACECYETVKRHYGQLLGTSNL